MAVGDTREVRARDAACMWIGIGAFGQSRKRALKSSFERGGNRRQDHRLGSRGESYACRDVVCRGFRGQIKHLVRSVLRVAWRMSHFEQNVQEIKKICVKCPLLELKWSVIKSEKIGKMGGLGSGSVKWSPIMSIREDSHMLCHWWLTWKRLLSVQPVSKG